MQSRITRDFVDADLAEVVRDLGEAAGRQVYLGPGLEGKLTVSLHSVPPIAALHEVLASFYPEVAYTQIGKESLIVAVNGFQPRSQGHIRQEILLERAPAAKVIDELQKQFKKVEFIPHPALDGFWAVGARADILKIKNLTPYLDRACEFPENGVREFIQVRFSDLDETHALLQTLVPELTITADSPQSTLILEGTPGQVDQAKELLTQLDHPLDQVILECKFVRLTGAVRHNLQIDWGPIWVARSNDSNATKIPLRVGAFSRNQLASPMPSSGEATVMSFPTVALNHGQPGTIDAGDIFPISDQEVGLKLTPTTTVEENGALVHCLLRGQFKILARSLSFDGTMNLKDGQSIVIDGLLPPQDALDAVKAVPLLADLPVTGHLFRNIDPEGCYYLFITPNVMK